MARSSSNFRPGVLLLALAIAVFLWGVAQGSASIRYEFNVPVEIHGVADSLVVTEQTAQSINIAITGTRAALRNLDESRAYELHVSNAKPGMIEFDVDRAQIQLPSRARFVNHSPTRVRVRLEKKERKQVPVVADVQGLPAEGFELAEVRVVPDRVWVEGARSQVNRLSEIATESIDVAGLRLGGSREVSVILRGANVWLDDEKLVTVQLVVQPVAPPPPVDATADAEEGDESLPADAETLEGDDLAEDLPEDTAEDLSQDMDEDMARPLNGQTGEQIAQSQAEPEAAGNVDGGVGDGAPASITAETTNAIPAQRAALKVSGPSPVAAPAPSSTNVAAPIRAATGEGS